MKDFFRIEFGIAPVLAVILALLDGGRAMAHCDGMDGPAALVSD